MGDNAPGLTSRKRKDGSTVYYWIARRVSARAGKYPLKTVRLVGEMHAIEARCRLLTQELRMWLAERGEQAVEFRDTLGSLIDCYQKDEDSPYRDVRANTRSNYDYNLKILRKEVGADRVDGLNRKDFRKMHGTFMASAKEGGPQRIRRAHGLMTMVRGLISFGVSMRYEGCAETLAVLNEMTFELPKRRDKAITFAQAQAVIDAALAADPPTRSVALGQAIQFELGLRQIDVIGQWVKAEGDGGILYRGKLWTGGLTWSDLTAEKLAKRTSKTGQEGQWNPANYPLLVKAIAAFSDEERVGPAIIDERTGQPYKSKEYARVWRDFADTAGVPLDVWNMDSRAGALTEASEAGAQADDIRNFATHASYETTQRYVRKTTESTDRVQRLRVALREKNRND